jgi:hypothetical protein
MCLSIMCPYQDGVSRISMMCQVSVQGVQCEYNLSSINIMCLEMSRIGKMCPL